MDLKRNADEQREYLENHLENINVIISAILGIKINLEVKEKTNWRNDTYFSLLDSTNRRTECGIMKAAYKNVYIESFGMWWNENGVTIDLHYQYEHIDGGSNGASFCKIKIENELVSLFE